jgi:hypothetical protein
MGEKGSTPDQIENNNVVKYVKVVKYSAKIMNFLVQSLIDLMNIISNTFAPVSTKSKPYSSSKQVIRCYRMQA